VRRLCVAQQRRESRATYDSPPQRRTVRGEAGARRQACADFHTFSSAAHGKEEAGHRQACEAETKTVNSVSTARQREREARQHEKCASKMRPSRQVSSEECEREFALPPSQRLT